MSAGGRRGRGKTPNRGPARGAGGSARRPPAEGPPVVGKRPSRPLLLFVCALMWFTVAIFAYLGLHAGWKLIPTICFAGLGFLYLRGAAGAYSRRPGGEPTPKK